MFTTFLKVLTGYFGRHWLLSAFLPSLAYWSLGLLIFAIAGVVISPVELWTNQSLEVRVLLTAGGLGWVTFFAYLLGNIQTSLIRFFEGYWRSYPLVWLRDVRLRYHRRRSRYLEKQVSDLTARIQVLSSNANAENVEERQKIIETIGELRAREREWFLFYPFQEDAVMPSRLGNIIRSSELYAYGRYSIDAVVVWPRLFPFLPEDFVGALLSAKADMTLMLTLSVLAFTFALIACGPLAFFTNHWILFLFCALGFLFAWLFYLASLQGAQLYAELIKSAFDLYRWKLLEALHIRLPTSYQEENTIWKDITHLIYRNEPLTLAKYQTAPQEPPTASRPGLLQAIQDAVMKLFQSCVAKDSDSTLPRQQSDNDDSLTDKEPRDLFPYCYFGVIVILCLIAVLLMRARPTPGVYIPVMARDVPRYHLVTEADLTHKCVDPAGLASGSVSRDDDILAHYTLEPLLADSVIRRDQMHSVPDLTQLTDVVAIGIPASEAMVLGDTLRAGDVVDLLLVRDGTTDQRMSLPALFENILVLDVRPASKDRASEAAFIIVLALPKTEREGFAKSSAAARCIIARRP